MDQRLRELEDLKSYIHNVDNELGFILESLQWDKNHILQGNNIALCTFNKEHRMPEHKKEVHEKKCILKCLGYSEEDKLLPDAEDGSSKACVKFSKEDLKEIFENASRKDPLFQTGKGYECPAPLSVDRIRCTYTVDERRALYDAVVATAPTQVEQTEFTVPSGSNNTASRQKSLLQLLAEQRDLKRRRMKYRVTTMSKNYSQELREVIHNQMEMYAEMQAEAANKKSNNSADTNITGTSSRIDSGNDDDANEEKFVNDNLRVDRIKYEGDRKRRHDKHYDMQRNPHKDYRTCYETHRNKRDDGTKYKRGEDCHDQRQNKGDDRYNKSHNRHRQSCESSSYYNSQYEKPSRDKYENYGLRTYDDGKYKSNEKTKFKQQELDSQRRIRHYGCETYENSYIKKERDDYKKYDSSSKYDRPKRK